MTGSVPSPKKNMLNILSARVGQESAYTKAKYTIPQGNRPLSTPNKYGLSARGIFLIAGNKRALNWPIFAVSSRNPNQDSMEPNNAEARKNKPDRMLKTCIACIQVDPMPSKPSKNPR